MLSFERFFDTLEGGGGGSIFHYHSYSWRILLYYMLQCAGVSPCKLYIVALAQLVKMFICFIL